MYLGNNAEQEIASLRKAVELSRSTHLPLPPQETKDLETPDRMLNKQEAECFLLGALHLLSSDFSPIDPTILPSVVFYAYIYNKSEWFTEELYKVAANCPLPENHRTVQLLLIVFDETCRHFQPRLQIEVGKIADFPRLENFIRSVAFALTIDGNEGAAKTTPHERKAKDAQKLETWYKKIYSPTLFEQFIVWGLRANTSYEDFNTQPLFDFLVTMVAKRPDLIRQMRVGMREMFAGFCIKYNIDPLPFFLFAPSNRWNWLLQPENLRIVIPAHTWLPKTAAPLVQENIKQFVEKVKQSGNNELLPIMTQYVLQLHIILSRESKQEPAEQPTAADQLLHITNHIESLDATQTQQLIPHVLDFIDLSAMNRHDFAFLAPIRDVILKCDKEILLRKLEENHEPSTMAYVYALLLQKNVNETQQDATLRNAIEWATWQDDFRVRSFVKHVIDILIEKSSRLVVLEIILSFHPSDREDLILYLGFSKEEIKSEKLKLLEKTFREKIDTLTFQTVPGSFHIIVREILLRFYSEKVQLHRLFAALLAKIRDLWEDHQSSKTVEEESRDDDHEQNQFIAAVANYTCENIILQKSPRLPDDLVHMFEQQTLSMLPPIERWDAPRQTIGDDVLSKMSMYQENSRNLSLLLAILSEHQLPPTTQNEILDQLFQNPNLQTLLVVDLMSQILSTIVTTFLLHTYMAIYDCTAPSNTEQTFHRITSSYFFQNCFTADLTLSNKIEEIRAYFAQRALAITRPNSSPPPQS